MGLSVRGSQPMGRGEPAVVATLYEPLQIWVALPPPKKKIVLKRAFPHLATIKLGTQCGEEGGGGVVFKWNCHPKKSWESDGFPAQQIPSPSPSPTSLQPTQECCVAMARTASVRWWLEAHRRAHPCKQRPIATLTHQFP